MQVFFLNLNYGCVCLVVWFQSDVFIFLPVSYVFLIIPATVFATTLYLLLVFCIMYFSQGPSADIPCNNRPTGRMKTSLKTWSLLRLYCYVFVFKRCYAVTLLYFYQRRPPILVFCYRPTVHAVCLCCTKRHKQTSKVQPVHVQRTLGIMLSQWKITLCIKLG